VTDRLSIIVSPLAADQIRAAAAWWETNRSKAPAAFREDLERATELIALQPELGARARNTTLVGVRRLHLARIRYDLYYRSVDGPPKHLEILACWHSSRGDQPPI
jgi:plasmid stabilization system protein ParE